MYYADLSVYQYWPSSNPLVKLGIIRLVNVGWLDENHSFCQGIMATALIDKLFTLCESPMNITRGMHKCPFCGKTSINVERFGRKVVLGHAEIRLQANWRIEFTSPNMILHYVIDHQYLPPDQFVAALERL
jgi:hypothetical protein